jgi:two-component system, OmpR family, copper resistance phosphate regulon response regulator CusR
MRILVIEDEPRILDFLQAGLEAEGFVVEAAEDGAAGLRLALSGAYDLVVLDLLLPRIDGLRLLTELRRAHVDTPVLILSARSDLATKLRGFDLGADDYLAKPFSFDELVARVRAHTRHRSGEPTATVRAGALELDVTRRRARLGGRMVDLSDREFRLLHHLVSHAGETVSRERLLSEVWGYSFDPGSNVVDVCVRRLRKKLGTADAIETVRNAGYRIATA